jgi:hypothetical protein
MLIKTTYGLIYEIMLYICIYCVGMLELWGAVLFDVGALLVVVIFGSSMLLDDSFAEKEQQKYVKISSIEVESTTMTPLQVEPNIDRV